MDLKKCPFCGGEIFDYKTDQGDKWGRVACCCGACGPEVRTGYNLNDDAVWHKEADREWNTRAYDSIRRKVIEECANICQPCGDSIEDAIVSSIAEQIRAIATIKDS